MGRHRLPDDPEYVGRHRVESIRPLNPRPLSGRRTLIVGVLAAMLVFYPVTATDGTSRSILGDIVVPFISGEASATEEVITDPTDEPESPPVVD
jgi:hypothetical protein